MNRNDAAVNVELPPRQHALETQPFQKNPSKGDTSTDQKPAPSISHASQATTKKPAEGTRDHRKGSDESHTLLFTDLYASPTLSPGIGEKCSRGSVSPCWQDSRAVAANKTVKETKVDVPTKASHEDVAGLLVQSESKTPCEKVEVESVAHIKPTERETTEADNDGDVGKINPCEKQEEESERGLKRGEKTSPQLQRSNVLFHKSGSVVQDPKQSDSDLPNFQLKDPQEVPKPVAKVESVAELLRMQIKALDSILAHSASTIPLPDNTSSHSDQVPKETYKDSAENGDLENKVNQPAFERENTPNNEDTPCKNLKETLMELYHLLIRDQNEADIPEAAFQPVQSKEKNNVIAHVENEQLTSPDGSAKNYETGNGLKNGTSNWLPNQSELVTQVPGSPVAVTLKKLIGQEPGDVPKSDKDVIFRQKTSSESELTRESETGTQKTVLFDQSVLDKANGENNSFLSVQKPSTKDETQTDYNPTVKEFRIDSLVNSNTAFDSSLEERSGVSLVPCATAQELAAGARRKVQVQKAKPEGESADMATARSQTQPRGDLVESVKLSKDSAVTSLSARPSGQLTQPQPSNELASSERCSPLQGRRKIPPGTERLTKDILSVKPGGNSGLKDREESQDPYKGTLFFSFFFF